MQWFKTWVLRAKRPGFKFQLGHEPAAELYLGKSLCSHLLSDQLIQVCPGFSKCWEPPQSALGTLNIG